LAEAVQSASDDPDAVRRFAARMQIEAQRLSNLVNDVIDLSRLQDGPSPDESVPVPIAHVVAEAVDSTRLAATVKDIEIVTSVEAGLTVLGAEAQLATALRNLLVNAVLYSDSNTRVAVVARSVQSEQGAHLVEVSVKDQGVGISAADLPRVFERFYRVDPARSRGTGGTGLGLAIVKHVATNHGGECLVWSLEGEGATFTLRLPSYEALHSDHVHEQFAEVHEIDEFAERDERVSAADAGEVGDPAEVGDAAEVADNQSTTASQDLFDPIESAPLESPTEEMHP
jgi:two-component system sensor histidine kinase SenX3